jgi:hypothetical protein
MEQFTCKLKLVCKQRAKYNLFRRHNDMTSNFHTNITCAPGSICEIKRNNCNTGSEVACHELQVIHRLALQRPVRSATHSRDVGVLLDLRINSVRTAAHLSFAIHPRHRPHLVQWMLVALQPSRSGEEET